MIWRELSSEEEEEFRQWARDNHKAGGEINPTWHPIVRDECNKIEESLYER